MKTKETQDLNEHIKDAHELIRRLEEQNKSLLWRISRLENFILRDNVNWSENVEGLGAMLANGSMTEFVTDTVKSKLYIDTGHVEWGDN